MLYHVTDESYYRNDITEINAFPNLIKLEPNLNSDYTFLIEKCN